ncbi:MAG: hypothetical protein K9J27_13120, partial [Bacteroidales bacterium]|nr:hypothetical protein [Bacteroidales bacterium]
MKSLSFFLLFFLGTSPLFSQWDPDAGIIEPYTENAFIEARGKNKEAIHDNDFETKWESSNPLPQHYIKDKSQNVFLKYA